jgi:hypothetical protein
MIYYRQCVLCKEGTKFIRSWIPEKFAKINKCVKLKKKDGNWEDGWIVTEVTANRQTEEFVLSHRDDYRYQRQRTDI